MYDMLDTIYIRVISNLVKSTCVSEELTVVT